MYTTQLLALHFLALPGLASSGSFESLSFSDFINLSNGNILALFADHKDPKALILNTTSHERRWANGVLPNPATDEVWEAAKCKGRKFMAQMSYSDYDAGQSLPTPANTVASPWTFNHLGPWGYVLSGVDTAYRNFAADGYWGIADFFRHIGISDRCKEEGGNWYAAVITHYQTGMPGSVPPKNTQTYVGPDGYQRRVSGAYFYMAVTPDGGIIVQNSLGPRQAADRIYTIYQDYELPWVKQLSDMMWAMWEYFIPVAARTNIKFFMSLGINNPQSLTIIRRAMESAGQQLSSTPYLFDMNSDGALALLGSPNGARVAHFLTQRKNQVGLKTVTGVYAFECASASRAPCLMFNVGPIQAVPQPQQRQQAEEAQKREMVHKPKNFIREHIFRFGRNMTVESRYV